MSGEPEALDGERLGRNRRLNDPRVFARFAKPDSIAHSPCFQVRVLTNNVSHARLALAVSRRIARRAHDRNRIKRIVRETFRTDPVRLRNFDLLVVARPYAARTDKAGLAADLTELWSRLSC